MKKKLVIGLLFVFSFAIQSLCAQVKVLYDDSHGQTAGNADWVVTGAYSDMADMLKSQGFAIDSLSDVAPSKHISVELLAGYKALILAEPNNPYAQDEQNAIVSFVKNGGGAFLISDHGGADRDNDGWDAVKALNSFCPQFGFQFDGNTFSEAPLAGAMNSSHPVMFGIKAVGAWAASTISILRAVDSTVVPLVDSRTKKAPFIVAAETGKGRIVAMGDSSPFDDGTGSGGKNKLHDSYDSFMYNHPQFAYNAMTWITGMVPAKRIPSKIVRLANEADPSEKGKNVFIDAAHGNAASDKMETFERHMAKLGFKVYYGLNLLTPDILEKFSIAILPDPSLPLLQGEIQVYSDWLMAGGSLFIAADWDSAPLKNIGTLNNLMEKCGSVMRFNSDQVWDNQHKTNKPWGVLANTFKAGHPIFNGVKTIITWGTCSLITRDKTFLTESSGVEIWISGDNDCLNKDGDKMNDAVIYPVGGNPPIPIMAMEKLVKGKLIALGCCNFTDYQYPDSDLNASQSSPSPIKHETAEFYDNLIPWLAQNSQNVPFKK
ncbi:MAG: hypothetical protein HQM08_03835 [Candidatus Riflebacteria bacterium]|nr:hypothetical protein [Candidatus Riflebacteria bacterium]